MKLLRFAAIALLAVIPMTACDDDDPVDPIVDVIVGTISGNVSVEGTGLAGVTVNLVGAASQSATTGSAGGYTFANVPGGTYGVQISGASADVTFASTSVVVTISTNGQAVTADFGGNYIRTSSIVGTITSGNGAGIVASVALTGVEARSGGSDTNGRFEFTGLRSGDYTVTVSDLPDGVTLTTSARDVTVATGQSSSVAFVGTVEQTVIPATVTISSVLSNITGLPVVLTAVVGQIDVTLTIDPGDESITKVALLMNDVEVASQDFSSGVAGEDEAMAAPTSLVLSVNTAFATAAGVVSFPNAVYTLKGTISTSGPAGETTQVAQSSTSITTINPDALVGTLSSAASAVSAAAVLWLGGDITVDVVPVLFSGKIMGAIAMTLTGLNPTPGAIAATITDVAAPYQAVFLSKCTGTPGPLCGYQSNAAGIGVPVVFDNVTIGAATYADGTTFLGGSTINGAPLPALVLADNIAPSLKTALTFFLPEQLAAGSNVCCSAGWLPPDFAYSSALGATEDDDNGVPGATVAGVGGVTKTFHSGAATLSSTALRALADAATPAGAGLAPGLLATDNQVQAGLWDALSNVAYVALNASPTGALNPATTFGIDGLNPTASALAGVLNQTIYNLASVASTLGLTFTSVEDRAGFGAASVEATLFRLMAGTNTAPWLIGKSATSGGIVNIAAGLAACAGAAPSNAAPCIPDGGAGNAPADAYYTFVGTRKDQAGNPGTTFTREILWDRTIPTTSNVAIPPTLTGGATATFSAAVADILDLYASAFAFDWTGAGAGVFLPFGDKTVVSDGRWDGTLTTTASAVAPIPFVRSVELASTGYVSASPPTAGSPSGVLLAAANVRVITEDAAGNLSAAAANNFIAGTVPAGTADAATTDFIITNTSVSLCNGGAGTCIAAGKASVTLTAVARGQAGTFANPFGNGKVYFYLVTEAAGGDGLHFTADDIYELLGTPVDGASAAVTDTGAGATGRSYTWSLTITSADVAKWALGAARLVVIGVDAGGDALVASPNNNVTIVQGT